MFTDAFQLSIYDEEAAELEAQCMRLLNMDADDMAAAAGGEALKGDQAQTAPAMVVPKEATAAAALVMLQFSHCKLAPTLAPAPMQAATTQKRRGRPPGSLNKCKKSDSSLADKTSVASAGSAATKTTDATATDIADNWQPCAQIFLVKEMHRLVYCCIECNQYYATDFALVKHWRLLHQQPELVQRDKRPRKRARTQVEEYFGYLDPWLQLNGLDAFELESCAQLQIKQYQQGIQQLCLACNSHMDQSDDLLLHLEQKHGISKSLMFNEEPFARN